MGWGDGGERDRKTQGLRTGPAPAYSTGGAAAVRREAQPGPCTPVHGREAWTHVQTSVRTLNCPVPWHCLSISANSLVYRAREPGGLSSRMDWPRVPH